MKKPLKFRVWRFSHFKQKYKYYYLNNCKLTESCADLVFMEYDEHWIDDKVYLPSEDDIVEQFTGSVDSTGKDIYEGDICQMNDWKPKPIVWHGGLYWLGNTQVIICEMEGKLMKVIGNIHENPELIEGET